MTHEGHGPTEADLTERIRRLEAENAALREGSADAGGPRRRGRALLAGVLVALGVLLTPIAVTAQWARASVADTDRYLAIVSAVSADPEVQEAVRARVTAAVLERVDPEAVTAAAVAALTPEELSPAGQVAVRALERTLAGALESLVAQVVDRVLGSDAFATFWREANRAAHAQVTGVLAGESTAVELAPDGTLSLQLGPIIDAAAERLTEAGIPLASRIPTIDTSITLVTSPELVRAKAAYALLAAVATWLPWLCLGLLVGGVLLARRRSVAVVGAALGIVALTVLTVITLDLAATTIPASLAAAGSQGVVLARAVIETVVASLSVPLRLTGALAAVVALVAFLSGASRPARTVRDAVGRTWRRLTNRGTTTAGVG